MMTLYQIEGCPYCHMVRQKLSDMELTYVSVCVSPDRSRRQKVLEASGQPTVPVLVDGDVVLADENEIIAYLAKTYGGVQRA
ncbi:MAG: glutathione S-transferase N-terminal domain-containing protein [Thermaerobacter sp.]|nr:glutathione S-transferase N-terminal domain-containing protein [Thermaerobacter sp.]